MIRALTMFAGIIFLAGTLARGQGLEENLNILKEKTVTVKDKKTEYQQSFSHDPDNNMLFNNQHY
jgi:hypothetical protein